MADPRHLIYLCTCDFLANDPATHVGKPEKLLGAFNLVSIAQDPEESGPASTEKMLYPWGKRSASAEDPSDPPAIGEDFILLTFPDARVFGPIDVVTDLPLKTVGAPTINDTLARQMEKQFTEGASTVTVLDKKTNGPQVGEDHTWSATLAGASQQGYPVAHHLGLSYWLAAGANNELPDIGDKWAVMLPKTFFGLPLPKQITVSRETGRGIEVQAEAIYEGADGGARVRLKIDAFKIKDRSPALSHAFIGQGQTIHAATFTNWLGTLPQTLGEFLDWVWILRKADWTGRKFGKKEDPAGKIFRDTSAKRKQQQMRKEHDAALQKLPGVGITFQLAALAETRLILDSEAPIRRYVIEPMLLLFQDHADIGLRRPFYDRENIGESERSGSAGISESLAMDLLGHLARSVPGASPDVNEELRALLAEVTNFPLEDIYPDVRGTKTEAPQLVQWTRNILLPTLDQIDKGEDNQSHSGLYAKLREVLEFEAELRPLWGTENGEDLSNNNGDQNAITLTSKTLAEAWEELSRLQEDENALLLLFCRQWDSLLNGLRQKNFPRYKKWIGLLGFEDNRKEGSDLQASPLPILNGRLRESIRDLLQQTHTRLNQRYADGLTGTLIRTDDAPPQPLIEKLETVSDPNSLEGALFRSLLEKLMKAGETLPAVEALANEPTGKIDFMKVLPSLARHSADLTPTPPGVTLDEASKRAIRCQHFQAAVYTGKALSVYLELRPKFQPPALLPTAFTPDPQGKIRSMEIPSDACQLMVQALSLGSSGQQKPEDTFWKQFSWASHLIGLNRAAAYLPTPPPLPVPLVASNAEYSPTRYSGVLVLARRNKVDGEQKVTKEGLWWLVNIGEAVVGDIVKDPTVNANPALPDGTSGELTDVQSDEVKMNAWMDKLVELGKLVRFSDPRVVPAPWQVAESFGVTQSVVEFRGKPIGVKLWDDAADDPLANTEIATGGRSASFTSPIKLARYQIIDPEDGHLGWGPVPGLRYHKGWQYQFLFTPIHNTGALHSQLRKDLASPGHLGARAQMNLSAQAAEHVVTVTNYVRRVPVQQIRLARELTEQQRARLKGMPARLKELKDAWAAGNDLPEKLDELEFDLKSLAFQDFQPPAIAAGVRPLYADLQDKETYSYLESLKPIMKDQRVEKDKPARPLALPSQTILLQQLSKSTTAKPQESRPRVPALAPEEKQAEPADSVRFVIRPPATTVENWTIWQSTQIDDAPDQAEVPAIMDCLADMNRLVRENSADTNSSLVKGAGLEVPQLIDDPAVDGVMVRVRMILNLSGRADAEPSTTEILRYFPFRKQELKSYPAKADPTWVSGDKLSELVAQLCRQQVQTMNEDAKEQGWTLEVQLGQGKLTFTQKGVVIVPEGCVVEIETVPCILMDDHKDSTRFGIYRVRDKANPDGELESYLEIDGAKDVYGVLPAIYRIWVEGVPSPEPSQDLTRMALPAPGYLPKPLEVWNALRLAKVGTHGREARDVSRLEIAVLPPFASVLPASDMPPDLLRKWCFVSEVYAEIQPWVWRGLPEDKPDFLSVLIPQADAPDGGMDRDMSPAILQKLVEGEAPAFGEREDAAARVQAGLVNYAATAKLLRDKVEQAVPPFIVYQDAGEQEEVPRYYRVKLVIKSRYAGIGAAADADRTQQIHATPVSSEYPWEWPALKDSKFRKDDLQRTSSHRRILFRGQLRRKLDLPRVKMVIPVLDALIDEKAVDANGKPDSAKSKNPTTARPGFIVLTREPLRSPWHRLIADVDWARVNVGGAGDAEVIKELPEFGPDPITSENSFDWAFRAKSDLRAQSEVDGRAFGLTYEREADAAAFPNAGFYFHPPFQKPGGVARAANGKSEDLGPTGSDIRHDWFAKVRFRWEVRPSHVMDNLASTLVSESTQPWQVRLLAPFRWIGFEQKEADLENVTFKMSQNRPLFLETIREESSGKPANLIPLGAPLGPKYPRNNRQPEASPMAILLFVAWSLVPDFLNAERSKIAHSIYAFRGKDPLLVYRNDLLGKMSPTDTRGGRPEVSPDGGNFLLVFGRSGDLDELLEEIGKLKPNADGDAGLNILVDKFLFPKTEGRLRMEDQDARAMITRCSPPIFAS